MDEDIDYNPFYQALQGRLYVLHQRAQDKCYTICLPHSSCIRQDDISSRFAEMHILRKSPYFQGAFMTTDMGHSGTLRLEKGHLITAEGFKDQGRRIKVLSEEIGYNSEYKTYRILLLAEPIWTEEADIMGAPRRKSQALRTSLQDPFTIKISFEDNKQFLECFAENREALSALDNRILQFNQNYVVLKAYLQDASKRLEGIWQEAADAILNVSHNVYANDRRYADVVCCAVESYLLGHVYRKILPVICEACQENDELVKGKLAKLTGVTPRQLGVPQELCCPLQAAIMEIDKLEGLHTPLEKMDCLKKMLDTVTESVNSHVNRNQRWGDNEPPCLTSDELIPLIICVLVESNCRQLESQLLYIEEFHWSTQSKDDLSFSYVTFKAAIEHVKHNDVLSPIKKSPQSPQQSQMSMQFPLASSPTDGSSSSASTSGTPSKPTKDEPPTRRPSRLDRQMERINKMLASTSIEKSPQPLVAPRQSGPYMGPMPRYPTREFERNTKKSQLGEFLSSLQDDNLGSAYGKQT